MPRPSTLSLTLNLAVLVLLAACGAKPKPETPAPSTGQDGTAAPDRPASADADREARERAEREREAAALTQPVYFAYDEAALSPAARATLDAKAAALRTGALRLVINGHADERGSDEYNLALGMRRATAARRYLTQAGIASSRLEVVSYGEERPANAGHDERAYAANRRDEFVVAAVATSVR